MRATEGAAKQPATLRLADYKRPEFLVKNDSNVNLVIEIHKDGSATATSEIVYSRANPVKPNTDPYNRRKSAKNDATVLVLNAENPNPGEKFLLSLAVNGHPLQENKGYFYHRDTKEIWIPVFPSENEVRVTAVTHLEPAANSQLMGLYKSDDAYVTQCESEGFRRITPFIDRPDVMATYKVTLIADEKEYPVLLSNGNEKDARRLAGDRHAVTYEDPGRKPSYLFAAATGKFDYVEDTFTNMAGRDVTVRIYTEPGKAERAVHALQSELQAMKWDEDTFGRLYDLDNFNVVTVSKFTYGAMENTSLNVFRDSLVLASPDTATDDNYQRVTDVIGHEFFHHWSGNLVTLANWFNLSLKEGLTVLREQMFTAYTTSDAWERIRSVQELRGRQFIEDDSPLAMPVMPAELQSVNNIYNGTTYDKGAEVLRMMMTMMGKDTFIQGVKNYFDTYKGQAVTIDHFIGKMEEVSGLDLSGQFKLWYTQSGRPRVKAEGVYDPQTKTYTLTLEQKVPPTQDQPDKKPMYIPVKMGLVDENGNDLPLVLDTDDAQTANSGNAERVLHFTRDKQTFVFTGVDKPPAFHSLFRDFSSPVTFDPGLGKEQLLKQMVQDTNGFNRWDAGQQLALGEMKRLYQAYQATGNLPAVDKDYLDALKAVVQDTTTDPALVAEALTLPGIKEFEAAVKPADPAAISAVRKHLKQTIGQKLYDDFKAAFNRTNAPTSGPQEPERTITICRNGVRSQLKVTAHPDYSFDYESVGKRSLKKVAVGYMLANGGAQNVTAAKNLYDHAGNMTDRMIALGALNDHFGPERDAAMQDFYDKFRDDSLVIQKWFVMQGYADSDEVFDQLDTIVGSNVFNWENPGHAQSLFGGLTGNYEQFHRPDGKGYEYLADVILKLDKINGATASRFVGALSSWQDYSGDNQKLMIAQLQRLAAVGNLSIDVKEKVLKSLPKAGGEPDAQPQPPAPAP